MSSDWYCCPFWQKRFPRTSHLCTGNRCTHRPLPLRHSASCSRWRRCAGLLRSAACSEVASTQGTPLLGCTRGASLSEEEAVLRCRNWRLEVPRGLLEAGQLGPLECSWCTTARAWSIPPSFCFSASSSRDTHSVECAHRPSCWVWPEPPSAPNPRELQRPPNPHFPPLPLE